MKKLISILTLQVLILSLLISCSEPNRKYDESEVKAAAESLIRDSETLNMIYWGKGIGYIENESSANGYYREADPTELARLGISSTQELKSMTMKTFSLAYSESIFSTVLSSLGNEETGILGYTRYYQNEDKLMVYSQYKVLLTDEVTYLYDTIKVEGSKGDTVYVTVDVKIKRGELTQTRSVKIGLKEETDGWRIDTPSYAVYREDVN